eukprot:scaffold25116_cov69-Phaeocystis_antarctica.AAC.2
MGAGERRGVTCQTGMLHTACLLPPSARMCSPPKSHPLALLLPQGTPQPPPLLPLTTAARPPSACVCYSAPPPPPSTSPQSICTPSPPPSPPHSSAAPALTRSTNATSCEKSALPSRRVNPALWSLSGSRAARMATELSLLLHMASTACSGSLRTKTHRKCCACIQSEMSNDTSSLEISSFSTLSSRVWSGAVDIRQTISM